MSAVPLRKLNGKPIPPRVVSVLGATGSIGDSTMDLLRRARDRYRVEAITANSNVAALAKLAREFEVRFAAVADVAYQQGHAAGPAPNDSIGFVQSQMYDPHY